MSNRSASYATWAAPCISPFPDQIAAAIVRQDLALWAARNEIALDRPG